MAHIIHHDGQLFRKEPEGQTRLIETRNAVELIRQDKYSMIQVTSDQVDVSSKKLMSAAIEAFKTGSKIAIAAGDIHDDRNELRGQRLITSATAGLYRAHADKTAGGFSRHPANRVAQFLAATGSSSRKLRLQILSMGDIRYSYGRHHRSDNRIDLIMATGSTLPTADSIYSQSRQFRDGIIHDSWIRALFGGRKSAINSHRLLTPIVRRYTDVDEGVASACWVCLRLIIGHWLATEYHPELMCRSGFVAAEVDSHIYDAFRDWQEHERKTLGSEGVQRSQD